jgi:23S rRNA (pseudouridine1915-N3)-methyltransferase
MRIRVIAPGKIKEKWLKTGIDEYRKRLTRYCEVIIQELEDVPDSWPEEKALNEEAIRIMAKVKSQDYCVVLDLHGRQFDSKLFAANLQDWFIQGGSEIVFIIGGSNGLSPVVTKRAQVRLCLSEMTFTHQMTRLLLLEQCYRAFRINRNEPYHK